MNRYTRRLQRIGNSILVSLPKAWVDANGLTKNDEAQIEINHNTLSITAGGETRPANDVTISYPLQEEDNIAANITGAYLLGYDLIHIRGVRSIPIQERQSIRDALRRLVGMEIVEEDAATITAQFLPDAATLNPQKILKRMGGLVLGMFEDTLAALVSEDRSNLMTLPSRDSEVNRQYFLSVRLVRNAITDRRLADAFNLENVDVMDYRVAANILEATGDAIVELAEALSRTSIRRGDLEQVHSVAGHIPRMGEQAVDSFVSNDRRLAIEAITSHRENQEKIASLRGSLRGRSQVPIDLLDILYMFDRVERSWVDIADLVKPIYGRSG